MKVGGKAVEETLAGFPGDPGSVRGDEESAGGEEILGEEGVVGGGGLYGEDVQAGSGDASCAEGRGEGGLIDERAAAGVEEEGAGFHLGESGGVDELLSLGGEGTVQRNDVSGGEERFAVETRDVGEVGIAGAFPGKGLNAHAEGFGDAGDGGSDVAETHDAEGLSSEFDDGVVEAGEDGGIRPELGFRAVAVNVGGEIEEKGEAVLGDAVGGIAGDIADRDSVGFGRLEVDAIDPGGADKDELEIGAGLEDVCGDENFVGDDDVGSLATGDGFRGRGRREGGELG